MTYFDTSAVTPAQTSPASSLSAMPRPRPRNALVVVIEDQDQITDSITEICKFLDLHVVCLPGGHDLDETLASLRPMAVIAGIEAADQDGCHTLMQIAQSDASLPVLMITGTDPCQCGAVDAIEEVFALTHLSKHTYLPNPGDVVDFLARAGHAGKCLELLAI